MVTREKECARRLGARENEEFLAVGDEVARFLNPTYDEDRRKGKAVSLPDLLSIKRNVGYRLREVKFKLERELAKKALRQLTRGADLITGSLDRVEIVIPLGERRLKDDERAMLGETLEGGRYRLLIDGETVEVRGVPVSVIIL